MMKSRMLSLMSCLFVGWAGAATAQEFTDPVAWEQVIRGTGPFMEVTPNRVTITVPSASIDGELGQSAAFVRTACTVTGDFDVSVDFHLLTWPVGNGGRAGLNTEVSTASRVSFGGINGEVYFSTLGGVNIPTRDLNGSFRTARSGGVLSAYYKDSTTGNWVVMGSIAAPDTPLTMNLAVWAHRAQFTGADVVVAFDNFQVDVGDFPCFPADDILVNIDVPDRINVRSRGNLPVSILSTETFNATTVDARTVRFGLTGTEAAPVRWTVEDINADGRDDLRLLFAIQASGIPCGATSVSLTGQTTSEHAIHGSDTIMTTGCN
jgi:hypothetical protein